MMLLTTYMHRKDENELSTVRDLAAGTESYFAKIATKFLELMLCERSKMLLLL